MLSLCPFLSPFNFNFFFLLHFTNRAQPSFKKEEKKFDKLSEKDKDLSKKQEAKSGRSESVSSNSGQESLKKDERRHFRKLPFFTQ